MSFMPLNTLLGLSPSVPGHRLPGCQIIQNVHVLLEGEILNICGEDEVHGAQGVFVLSSQQIIIVTRKRSSRHSLSQGCTVLPCQSTPKRRSMTTVWKFFKHAHTASIRNEHTNTRDMTTKSAESVSANVERVTATVHSVELVCFDDSEDPKILS